MLSLVYRRQSSKLAAWPLRAVYFRLKRVTLSPWLRRATGGAALVAAALLGAPGAHAGPNGLGARLACQPVAAPGRVLCELEVEVERGRLQWADVLVVRSPSFARPLRSRVGPRQALSRSERRMGLPIALVATKSGDGRLEVLARAVECTRTRGVDSCLPLTTRTSASIHVGPITEGPR